MTYRKTPHGVLAVYPKLFVICVITIIAMLLIKLARLYSIELGFVRDCGLNFGAQILLTGNAYMLLVGYVRSERLMTGCNIAVLIGLICWEYQQSSIAHKTYDDLDVFASALAAMLIILYDIYARVNTKNAFRLPPSSNS